LGKEAFITIRKEGNSNVIAVTRILPKDWRNVNAVVKSSNENSVTIKFEKIR